MFVFIMCTYFPHIVYLFCVELKKNRDYFPTQYKLIGSYSRVTVCLLRGTNWLFKCKASYLSSWKFSLAQH